MAAPCLGDFTVLRDLGGGSCGTVHLVRENDTGGLYALKAIPKRKICGDAVMTERNTLLDLHGDDFILQLRACFQDSRNYYLVTVRDTILKGMNIESLMLTTCSRNTTRLEISTLCY
jgi:serine/threonine protein kinase